MEVVKTPLEGFLICKPTVYEDERGFFLETYQQSIYEKAGITDQFVQDNQSRSHKGVVRGMHFQVMRPQAQLITVLRGRLLDVGVDLRRSSPTFGKWFGVELSDDPNGQRQIYMAPGFAHGYCVLSEWVDLHYKVTRYYDPSDEGGLNWSDPDVNINWPVSADPKIAERDAAFQMLKNLSVEQLPHFPSVELTSTK
jgi:dTDP-4-dehydrorhamnose 3,5-epimerase